jgi:hypothetical protein
VPSRGSGVPGPPGRAGSTTVPGVLHPVGNLPAAVYWRRRLLLLVVLLVVLGGGGWFGYALWSQHLASASAAAAGSSAATPTGTPALEQVVPSLVSLRTPSALPTTAPRRTSAPLAPAPKPGGPCTDAMISLTVQAPAAVAAASKPTFALVVMNTSPVPCVRALDKGQQELVLLDSAGHRVWGSNDCFPEASSDTRTLAPRVATAFPVIWGGLTSAPTCTAPRTQPKPGTYVLRGRLATKTSPNTPIRLG